MRERSETRYGFYPALSFNKALYSNKDIKGNICNVIKKLLKLLLELGSADLFDRLIDVEVGTFGQDYGEDPLAQLRAMFGHAFVYTSGTGLEDLAHKKLSVATRGWRSASVPEPVRSHPIGRFRLPGY